MDLSFPRRRESSAVIQHAVCLTCFAGVIQSLDSRLRGNDGLEKNLKLQRAIAQH
jgi:hypothetical protein